MDTSGIIQALGGPAAIERATGFPLTTVDSWKRKGKIPSWRVPALIQLAVSTGQHEAANALEALVPARAA
jgi:hypothetical protein